MVVVGSSCDMLNEEMLSALAFLCAEIGCMTRDTPCVTPIVWSTRITEEYTAKEYLRVRRGKECEEGMEAYKNKQRPPWVQKVIDVKESEES